MAKTKKYDDDILLEAIVRYAEVYKEKIKSTGLAEWARSNVAGLEDVKDYHFRRSKLCNAKIQDFNASRSISEKKKTNVLLKSTNINDFLKLPETSKRNALIEVREMFDKLESENVKLRYNNRVLEKENKQNEEIINKINENLDNIRSEIRALKTKYSYLNRELDEEKIREELEKAGMDDGKYDFNKHIASLTEKLSETKSISDSIKSYYEEIASEEEVQEESKNIKGKVLKELFGSEE